MSAFSPRPTRPAIFNGTGRLNNLNNTPTTHPKVGVRLVTLDKYLESNLYIYYGIVSPFISTIVITLNILLITTLIKGKFKKSTHVIVIAIALADALTGFIPIPFNVYVFGLKKDNGYLTLSWCYVFEYTQKFIPEILHITSLHLTVGLGIERFIVVAFPLKAQRICRFRNGIIFSVLIFVVSIGSQMDLFTKVSYEQFYEYRKRTNKTVIGCLRSAKVRTDSEYALRIGILVFVPCMTLVIFTTLLLRKSKEIQHWRKLNSSQSQTGGLERLDFAVILIMIFIVVTEAILQTTFLISRIKGIRFTDTHEELVGVGHIIFQVTCPINLAILCFLSVKFRKIFKDIFCCCLKNINPLLFNKEFIEKSVVSSTATTNTVTFPNEIHSTRL
ncbi:sex peptide receptor-related protein 2-like [Mytilus californianus]|uniref:sex peptide receptor-related protein 2-like n=1 Tax=Mytilus californianus TaxID=6549 RepID=UPI00224519D1|nr:sex peptide receptor-related protein 2-like [Mytilus californianus]